MREIRQRFDSENQVKFRSVQQETLPYLGACINETLRMAPPQTNPGLQLVPEGGATICGEQIHKGCAVSASAFTMTHLRHTFARPTESRPERWLPPSDVG